MGITKTVGTTGVRDYSTIQAGLDFFDDYDFNSSGGESYLDIYPEGTGTDGEWVVSAVQIARTAENVTASNYLVIRAAPGYGFADHADKETNALRYNPANGVAIRITANSTYVLRLDVNHTHVRGLQFKTSAATPGSVVAAAYSTSPAMTVSGCILASTNLLSGAAVRGFDVFNSVAGNYTIVNCLFQRTRLAIYTTANSSTSLHNTIWHDGNNSAQFISAAAGRSANVLAYSGGTDDFTTPTGGSYSTSGIGSGNCASDDGTGPSTGLVDVLLSDMVESVTSGSEDFRLNQEGLAAALVAGRDSSSITTVDILGRTRDATTPTIGCYENVAAAGGVPKTTKLTLLGVG